MNPKNETGRTRLSEVDEKPTKRLSKKPVICLCRSCTDAQIYVIGK